MTADRLWVACVAGGCTQPATTHLEGTGPVCDPHRSARMRADTARATRKASDQGDCPDSAMEPTPIALSGHNPRSRACGRVALLRNKAAAGRGAVARLFCKSRQCPDCGPRRAQRLQVQFLDLLGPWLDANHLSCLQVQEIAPSAWPSLARKLRRFDAAYVRIPITDGADLLITQVPRGGLPDMVYLTTRAELEDMLATALTWTPSSVFDKRRPSHRGFADEVEPVANATGKGAAQGGDQPEQAPGVANAPGGWELLGFAGRGITLDMAVRAAQQLDLQPEPIGPRELAPDWAEAYTLRLPPEGTPELEVLCRKLRLRAPGQADDVTRRSRLAA
jgi:hypothetical protein